MEKEIKAFVSYRLPNEDDFTTLASYHEAYIDDKVNLTSQNTFFVTSFDKKVIFHIKPDEILTNEFVSCDFKLNHSPKQTRKSAHAHQVEAIKRKIQAGEFEKVVLSRIKLTDKPTDFDPFAYFQKLCKQYENAFVYILYSELSGLWMGASPELLIKKEQESYETVALAGTKLITEEWTQKEEVEQQFVTDFIVDTIKEKSKKLEVTPKRDKQIGDIKHIMTNITFEPYLEEEINTILQDIQPTPAVCGIPKQASMDYLKNLESHTRSFYAGAIGPVDINSKTALYVNLRCLQVCKDKLALYLGGGITADSNAKDEWIETERKGNILLQYLKN